MKHNVVAPSVGESITEVSILKWNKQNGQAVKVGDVLLEIESDKATVEIVAEFNGVLKQVVPAGERIKIGALIAEIDDAGKATVAASAAPTKSAPAATVAATSAAPATAPGTFTPRTISTAPITRGAAPAPAASAAPSPKPARAPIQLREGDRRVPMTTLRVRIAERLVQAQHEAAILTTFNECDMSAVVALRNKNKDAFKTKHGVSLSFMSFFTRAAVEALKVVPEVNATIDGTDVIYHDYYDVGIAVGSDRGLVVPVVRNCEKLGFVEIEKKIAELAVKARDGKLSIADMTGGTFTISNGGTYGSLMSTPILNPPQNGILGMHKIQDRPMAVDGKVEIRPMMYLALSYDHRLIDGKGAVTFLVTLKDFIEHPEKLKLEF